MNISGLMVLNNEDLYVEDAIASVINIVSELIIIDNGNNKIITSNDKIKLIKLNNYQTYQFCINLAIENANYDWVLRCDGDMIFTDKLIPNNDGIFFQAINLYGDIYHLNKENPYKTNDIFLIKKHLIKYDEKFIYEQGDYIYDNNYKIWHLSYCKLPEQLFFQLNKRNYNPDNGSFISFINSNNKNYDNNIKWIEQGLPTKIIPNNDIPRINPKFKINYFNDKIYYEVINPSTTGDKEITLTILVRNTEQYLKECLLSVFKQTSSRWKIVLVNDFSDEGEIIIDKYIDQEFIEMKNKIKIIDLPQWVGLPKAHSIAISYVTTDIIGVLDSDDSLTSDAIEEILKIYDASTDEIFVYSNFWLCDKDMNRKNQGQWCSQPKTNLLNERCASHFRTFMKKSYDKIDGYDEDLILGAVDQDLFFQLEEVAKPYYLMKYLYNYRYFGMISTITSMEKANNYMLYLSIFKNICRRYGNNQFCVKYYSTDNMLEYVKCRSHDFYGPSDKGCYYEIHSHDIFITKIDVESIHGLCDIKWDSGWIVTPYTGIHNFDSTFMKIHNKVTVNRYFNCVYVLNLRKDIEKKARMEKILSALGIDFVIFDAVYGKDHMDDYKSAIMSKDETNSPRTSGKMGPGAYGYTMTMNGIFTDAKQKGYKKILTFDDDVIFHKDFINKFDEYIRQVPHDWYLLFLGLSGPWTHPWVNNDFKNFTFDKVFINDLFNCDGSYAVGYDHRVFDEIIEVTLKFEYPFDTAMMKHFRNKYLKKCFSFYPYLAIADTTTSDISERSSDIEQNFSDYQFKYRCNLDLYDLASLDHKKYEKLKIINK